MVWSRAAIRRGNPAKTYPGGTEGRLALKEAKIFVAIRSAFAYSEDSSAGSGAGGTLPIGNPGLPEKACNSVVLWAFVSLPDAAALKGSKNARP
jgi:hypothetical protein